MSPASAEKHIRRAWIAANVWLGATILVALPFMVAGERLAGMRPVLILLSAGALLLVAQGVRRRSRLCALLLLLAVLIDLGTKALFLGWTHGIFDLILGYFFAAGVAGTFVAHRGGGARSDAAAPASRDGLQEGIAPS